MNHLFSPDEKYGKKNVLWYKKKGELLGEKMMWNNSIGILQKIVSMLITRLVKWKLKTSKLYNKSRVEWLKDGRPYSCIKLSYRQ